MSGAVADDFGRVDAAAPRAARLRPRGLPQRLPPGERLLWQGSPRARTLLRRMFHLRVIGAYFAVVLGCCALAATGSGATPHAAGIAMLHRVALAAVPFLLIAAYAWGIERTTVYSITTRRVAISFGMALPMTINLPFSKIASAGLRLYPDGSGDIPLRLMPRETMSYFVVWPHARPWRTARPEPMLRCIPCAHDVSAVLAQALADEVDLPHSATEARVARLTPSATLGARLAAE